MGNPKVLFVDDEEMILRSIGRGIVGQKFKGLFASSGKEALKIMEENEIALIVTDMRMPEMNGLELLTIVKEKYPDTVRMVLSGYSQITQIIATINKVGVFRFILKPWDLENDFLVAIWEAIEYYNLKKDRENLKLALESKNQSYQKLLKYSDEMLMNMKKGFNSFMDVNSYVLGNIKKIINATDSNLPSELVINYLNMTEEFYKKYRDIVFEVEKNFSFDKLFSEIEEYLKSKEKDVKFGMENKVTTTVKGRYKLVNLIVSTLVDKILEIYNEKFIIIFKAEEKEKTENNILVEINIIIKSSSTKEYREFLVISMFLNELLKEFNGGCKIMDNKDSLNIVLNQSFVIAN